MTYNAGMSDADVAWAAGFYEGEGYFGLHKKYGAPCSLRLSIGQRTLEPLERFQATLGGKIRHRVLPLHTRTKNHIEMWYLGSRGAGDALEMIEAMWPWLSRRRKEQALSAIEVWLEDHPDPVPASVRAHALACRIVGGESTG